MAGGAASVEAVTHFVCHHAYSDRRRYPGVEVCRECGEARTVGGYWEAAKRLHHPDGSLRTLDGAVVYRDWLWSRVR